MLNVCSKQTFKFEMTLYERRTVLCKRLFSKMLEPTHKLNFLLPPKNLQTYDLRSYPNLLVPTIKCKDYSDNNVMGGGGGGVARFKITNKI